MNIINNSQVFSLLFSKLHVLLPCTYKYVLYLYVLYKYSIIIS